MTAARSTTAGLVNPCASRALTGRCASPDSPRAMTLVELVVSMAIASLLVTGLAAALVLATRALPREDRPTDRVLRTSEVVDSLLTELQSALHVIERGARAITFTVADRDGDSSPERIRYSWSGVVGAPLTRQYKAGLPVSVLAQVRQFDVAYDVQSVSETYPGPNVEAAEQQLSANVVPVELKAYTVDNKNWIGQYAAPPAGAAAAGYLSWRITRVWFLVCRAGGADDTTRVQVCVANADGTPSDTVLDETPLPESALGTSFSWMEITFQNPVGVPITQGLCVVLRPVAGKPSMQIRYDNRGGSGLLATGDAGANWTLYSAKSCLHVLYARAAAPGPNQTATRRYITGVRLSVSAGTDAAARLDVQTALPNAPEMLSAVWEAEFDTDPTRLDMNADGQGDWVREDGLPFDKATLQNGVWKVDSTLLNSPQNEFAALTTIELRFRTATAGGDGAELLINADWTGGTFGPLSTRLKLLGNGTQTFELRAKRDADSTVTLLSVPGLPTDFVTLRLLIDPSLDTVNVRINGADKGTYRYFTFAPSGETRCVTLSSSASQAFFDYVRVRVAGS